VSYLPNEKSKPPGRFSIFREPSRDKKRNDEAKELIPFFLRFDQLVELDDVAFGVHPPDFIFTLAADSIGVELTTFNPAVFIKGGNRRREDFREWQSQTKANPQPVNTFEWGTFTLRESVASLKTQFKGKCDKVKRWNPEFSRKWLLLQLSQGSPFADLTGELKATPGHEEELHDHQRKVLFEVSAILAEPNPFDYVIIFAGVSLIAFPREGKNPLKLPSPRWDQIARGALIDDSHLDWTSTISHEVRTGGFNDPTG